MVTCLCEAESSSFPSIGNNISQQLIADTYMGIQISSISKRHQRDLQTLKMMLFFYIFCVLKNIVMFHKTTLSGDFPGGPVVKTLPSNAGRVGSIPGQGAKIPHASLQKTKT